MLNLYEFLKNQTWVIFFQTLRLHYGA